MRWNNNLVAAVPFGHLHELYVISGALVDLPNCLPDPNTTESALNTGRCLHLPKCSSRSHIRAKNSDCSDSPMSVIFFTHSSDSFVNFADTSNESNFEDTSPTFGSLLLVVVLVSTVSSGSFGTSWYCQYQCSESVVCNELEMLQSYKYALQLRSRLLSASTKCMVLWHCSQNQMTGTSGRILSTIAAGRHGTARI